MVNYLAGRQQRYVLNGQTSSWKNILVGVLQCSVMGPLQLNNNLNKISKCGFQWKMLFNPNPVTKQQRTRQRNLPFDNV